MSNYLILNYSHREFCQFAIYDCAICSKYIIDGYSVEAEKIKSKYIKYLEQIII